MIPKKIHFIWIGPPLAKWVQANLKRWKDLNPDFEIKVHGEGVLDKRYKDLYRRITDRCSRSDLLRLSVLRKEGGWYFDMDFVPLRPMSELYEKYDMSTGCFFTKQWDRGPKRIANGIIGLSVESCAWKEIDAIIGEVQKKILERTTFGPLLTTRVVNRVPEVTVGAINDFYSIRFNPKGHATEVYEGILKQNFSEKSLQKIFPKGLPFMFHLWMGGVYGRPVLNKAAPDSKATQVSTKYKRLVVACVLKSGGIYDVSYVRCLRNAVARHLKQKYEFVCLSDLRRGIPCRRIDLIHGWPGWWSKIELFRPGLFSASETRVIYFDLDTVLVDNIDELATKSVTFAMLHGFRQLKRRASGIMVWQGDYSKIWEALVNQERKPSELEWDQKFIANQYEDIYGSPVEVVQDMIPGVVSYKKDCKMRGVFPRQTRIVCFHGTPRPHEVQEKWVKQHWR